MTATSAEGLYAGWTIYGHGPHRFLHGALRRQADRGAVWECDHDHGGYLDARGCARRELRRRAEDEEASSGRRP
jgi:hypothetical protein